MSTTKIHRPRHAKPRTVSFRPPSEASNDMSMMKSGRETRQLKSSRSHFKNKSNGDDQISFSRNKNLSKKSFVKFKGRIKRSIKKTFPRMISSRILKDLPQTWAHFLDEYGKCDKNLSQVERPESFNQYGFMAPPEAFNESKRCSEVKIYLDKKNWRSIHTFYNKCKPLLDKYDFRGTTISLVDRTRQIVKFSINHPLDVVTRNVSLDAHAILSKDHFVLLDASKDWRMTYSPLVHGPPFIKFYAAVPIISKNGLIIGALTVFDSYPRDEIPEGLITEMQQVSRDAIDYVNQRKSSLSPRVSGYGNRTLTTFGKNARLENIGILETNSNVMPEGHLQQGLIELKGLNSNPSMLHLFQELLDSKDVTTAVDRAIEVIQKTLSLDLVYIVEVRTSFTYIIPDDQEFDYQNGDEFDLHDIELLGEPIKKNVHIRLIGGYGLPEESLKFDKSIHKHVLYSDYGMYFDVSE